MKRPKLRIVGNDSPINQAPCFTGAQSLPKMVKVCSVTSLSSQCQSEIPEGSLASWHLVSSQQKCRTKSSLAKEARLCFYVLGKKEITVVILHGHSRLINMHCASGRYLSRNNWIQLDLQMLTASLARRASKGLELLLEWRAGRNPGILFRPPLSQFPNFFHQLKKLFESQMENN